MRKSVLLSLTLSVASALFVFTEGAYADELSTLEPGARIRITVPKSATDPSGTIRITGRLVDITETSLTMQTSKWEAVPTKNINPPLEFLRQDIVMLEVSIAPSRKGRGALIGGAIGFITPFLIPDEDISGGGKALLAMLGGVTYALIGAAIAPGEKWQDHSPGQIELAFNNNGPGGNGVFVTFHF